MSEVDALSDFVSVDGASEHGSGRQEMPGEGFDCKVGGAQDSAGSSVAVPGEGTLML